MRGGGSRCAQMGDRKPLRVGKCDLDRIAVPAAARLVLVRIIDDLPVVQGGSGGGEQTPLETGSNARVRTAAAPTLTPM